MTDIDPDEAAGWEATTADVYRRLRACLDADRPAALAVVTGVEGSAYRRPGAKLVVTDETAVGAITAGCLEGPVADLAQDAMDTGEPRTQTYDLTSDDADSWGMGLGCNGVVDVLVDPVDDSLRPALDAVDRKERAVVCTAVASTHPEVAVGDRTTVLPDARAGPGPGGAGASDRDPLPDLLLDRAADSVGRLAALDRSRTVSVETETGQVTVFCDVFDPVPDLLVVGNQGDVRPVARLGSEVGFRVRVVTGRGATADPERFPAADEVLSTRAPAVASAVDAPEHTYAVVMSHNFVDDRLALAALLDAGVPYVGVMGPRERFAEMREAFAEEGRTLSADELDRVATPVGLDLGGDHPTRIAMSVVAEVLAVHNDRDGGRLSTTDGPIHPRED